MPGDQTGEGNPQDLVAGGDGVAEPTDGSAAFAAALAADPEAMERLKAELAGSTEGRRAIAVANVRRRRAERAEQAGGPSIPPSVGRRLARPDALDRWRRAERRSLVFVGDSIANQSSVDLRRDLHDVLPGGVSFGYAGLGAGVHAGWKLAGDWIQVGTGRANLGLPAISAAAVRSNGSASATLTWTCPVDWFVDRAELHWVDDGAATGFSLRVDDGPWIEVESGATDRPVFRATPIGPIDAQVAIRAARGDGSPCPSPVFLGLDVRDDGAANVVHALTFPGGQLAGRAGEDDDACLRPDRIDVAIEALARFEPTLVVWEVINDARSLDLDRLDRAVTAVEEALPQVDHVGIGVYEVLRTLGHDAGQDALHRYLVGRFDAAIDLRARWGEPDGAIAAGLLDPDGIHPTRDVGARDIATALSDLLSVDR